MGVIHVPQPKREPQRPFASAWDYPLGTKWRSDDGSIWVVEWDNQDKRCIWVLVHDLEAGAR